ncbi:hypothetical protein N5079_35240, partial [Planotetraspora sp. A-T 1434]|uniref:hypothetical protein n=1 Tax=Planotetraspora sp. A-T 1434 TaxID=2979219 RepID=UPI0021C0DFD0
ARVITDITRQLDDAIADSHTTDAHTDSHAEKDTGINTGPRAEADARAEACPRAEGDPRAGAEDVCAEAVEAASPPTEDGQAQAAEAPSENQPFGGRPVRGGNARPDGVD